MKVNPSGLAAVVPTQRDIARLFGVSDALVSRLFRQKVFRRGDTLPAICQAFLERAVALAEGTPSDTGEFEIERTALYRARRELAELEVAERKGALISATQAANICGAVSYSLRVRVWAWQNKLPGLLEHLPAPQIAKLLEDEARDVLTEAESNLEADGAAVIRWLEKNAPAGLVPAKAGK